jgi:hypothetical protein
LALAERQAQDCLLVELLDQILFLPPSLRQVAVVVRLMVQHLACLEDRAAVQVGTKALAVLELLVKEIMAVATLVARRVSKVLAAEAVLVLLVLALTLRLARLVAQAHLQVLLVLL